MKFTKRILIMTALAVTAAVSTGFAYDYVCNNSQYNCNTNTQYNCNNNANYATITIKIIAVKTQMLEDAADIENNIINTPKAYSTVYVL